MCVLGICQTRLAGDADMSDNVYQFSENAELRPCKDQLAQCV